MAVPAEEIKYTYEDLLSWSGEERYELVDGEPRLLAAPSDSHQAALGEISAQFVAYLRGKNCFSRQAPYDVMLFASREDAPDQIDTVLEPDLVVICDRSKRSHRGCVGAPDMVLEILSPSTSVYDSMEKLELYEAAGVREYWILDVERKKLVVYLAEGGAFRRREPYIGPAKVPVSVLDDFEVNMQLVYDAVEGD